MKNSSNIHVGTLVRSIDRPMDPARVGEVMEVKVTEWGTQYGVRVREEVSRWTGEVELEEELRWLVPSSFEAGNGVQVWSVIR